MTNGIIDTAFENLDSECMSKEPKEGLNSKNVPIACCICDNLKEDLRVHGFCILNRPILLHSGIQITKGKLIRLTRLTLQHAVKYSFNPNPMF